MSADQDPQTLIKKILEKIGLSAASVKHCLLLDRTGLLISKYSKYIFKELDIDAVGAIIGAVFQAGEEEGTTLDFKSLEIQINEFNDGFRFAVSCEDVGVLGVITDKNVNIGLVRASMKKYAPYLTKLLKKIFNVSPTTEAMEDLKDLFTSDFESFM
ncbi:MAG: roadblock/LC7 domain-containing protein [Promethearchaeota archaeon]